jgi:hypothetical protein
LHGSETTRRASPGHPPHQVIDARLAAGPLHEGGLYAANA